jgi:hypothetical protein
MAQLENQVDDVNSYSDIATTAVFSVGLLAERVQNESAPFRVFKHWGSAPL